MKVKRLRVFAGPNGSGKSALYHYLLSQNFFHQYYYINADEIALKLSSGFDLLNWPVVIDNSVFFEYLSKSSFLKYFNISYIRQNLIIKNNCFQWLGTTEHLSYISAAIADFLRNEMLQSESSFSCETVFSHPSKLDFLRRAKASGFKIYLYFIATKNPVINIGRVENRVKCGGHDVPQNKITERYYKTMDNLYDALCLSDEVFLFDNSESQENKAYSNFAVYKNKELSVLSEAIPDWFDKYILNKLQ